MKFSYQIDDSFVLELCSKLIFCSNIAQKGKKLLEPARTSKRCSKSQTLLKSNRVHLGHV